MALRLPILLVLALLFSCSGALFAQGDNVDVVIIRNDCYEVEFISEFTPSIGSLPQNGTITLVQDPIYNYTLTYCPDEDFTGSDNFLLVSFPFGFNVKFTRFSMSVQEAQIKARRDVVYTQSDVPVTVDVKANDFINVGNINLISAPVSNGGTVALVEGGVQFTPSPGFSGLADFNYVICTDDGNTCDLGTASVIVENPTASTDTLRVFTTKNSPQFILAAPGAQQLEAPDFGEVSTSGEVMSYQPEPDFVGDDYVTYGNGTSTDVFHITVLDLEAAEFTTEDRAQTIPGAPVTFNVLNNDLYGPFADCVELGVPRFGSLTPGLRRGDVIYTPPANWSGVDYFQYSSRPPGCNGAAESQTVFVNVTDFAPDQSYTSLTIPAGALTQLTYEVPGQTTSWSIVSGPTNGVATLDPVSGQINYLAGAPGTDQVVVNYCLSPDAAGNCQVSTDVTIGITATTPNPNGCIAGEGCVWPGDTNDDGVVDVSDLLPIGHAMGEFGTPRLSPDATSWGGQFGEPWGRSVDGTDLRHVDANGDQVISHLDTQIVLQHLGLAHRLRPSVSSYVDFEVTLRGDYEAEPGDLIRLDIVAGSNLVIVEDLTGFRFPFTYDPVIVDGNSVGIDFDQSGWASYDSPIMSISSNDESGHAEAAFTRTSRGGANGFGVMGEVSLVIVEDLTGFLDGGEETTTDHSGINRTDENIGGTTPSVTTILGGGAASMMNGAGFSDAVRVRPFELTINQRPATELQDIDLDSAIDFLDDHLLAFPNPTSNRLTVHLNGQQRFTALQLTDLTGRTLLRETGLDTNHRELDLSTVRTGLYTLTLTTADGVVNRKIEVVR